MSTDKIAVATLEEFMKKVRLASKANQKEIRLSISESENLVHNINVLILRLLDKMQEKEEKTEEDNVITVTMDGGNFNN